MPKILVCGRGGSGKSTLVALLAWELATRGRVLVVDADESNLGLNSMLGLEPPERTVMDSLGGKAAVGEKLMARLRGEGDEEVRLFGDAMAVGGVPAGCASRNGAVSMVRIGKIEHSMEGCACPMGVVARSFLNNLAVEDGAWVLVDTEAGVEHFGRGVLEGADYVLVVVDPSQEAVVMAGKACRLAEESGKPCGVALNKVNDRISPTVREKLAQRGIVPVGSIPFRESIARANLEGDPLVDEGLRQELGRVIAAVERVLEG